MRLNIKILLITVLVSISSVKSGMDEACNCDHCVKKNAEIKEAGNPVVVSSPLNKEDADGDGKFEICARSRDLEDKTFSSICHMLCHNRCTRFHETIVIEGKIKKYIATAYRTNYYKLRDGPCKKIS